MADMQWSELLGRRPHPSPAQVVHYGPSASQVIDLWLPEGPGPHRTVVLIHGGCWTASVANRHIMDWAADDLRGRGFAVANIEYRGVDQTGGGYPGTFQDVAAALDALPALASGHDLDLSRLVVVGHSAGGHLALWAAGRDRLPATSPLRGEHPLKISGVVDVAGIPDLQRDVGTACGGDPIRVLVGKPGAGRPDVYADTSPAALLPLGVPIVVIHGVQDHTVKPAVGEAFAQRARAAGDAVQVLTPPGGHVEEIAPGTPAWAAVVQAVERLSGSAG